MSAAVQDQPGRFRISCLRCERVIVARAEWIGIEAQCPYCQSLLRIPKPHGAAVVRAGAPSLGPRRLFNFPCPRCGCLLEAHTGMCGYPGRCPTCAARFITPHLRRRSPLPEKAQLLEPEAEPPAPVHAFASDGVHAPRIVARANGAAAIQCSQCKALSPIDADTCVSCHAPFTIEAASTLDSLRSESRATLSLGLGIVGAILFPLCIPGAIALWLGGKNLATGETRIRPWHSAIGAALGLVSLLAAAAFWYAVLK